ncbi:MAG: hypothetical protein ABFD07_14100 [Methanobacterium sp.]
MVELIEDTSRENRKKALETYERIKTVISPEYSIYHSFEWVAADYILEQGHLDCFIEKNVHKVLFLLNRKIGRFVYDGENSIGISTDDPDKVKEVSRILENGGFRVVVFLSDKHKWIH